MSGGEVLFVVQDDWGGVSDEKDKCSGLNASAIKKGSLKSNCQSQNNSGHHHQREVRSYPRANLSNNSVCKMSLSVGYYCLIGLGQKNLHFQS